MTIDTTTKKGLEQIKNFLKSLEEAARSKVREIGCAKAAYILKANQGYFSQVANGKRSVSSKKAVEILEKINEYEEGDDNVHNN